MQLVVGRIARAHGVGGEVSVDVRTDAADLRFAPGTRLDTDPPERGPLEIVRARWHSGRLLVAFASVPDRTAAEALRGTLLVADSATSPAADDPDDFWDHDLVGLSALTVTGTPIGTVGAVLHPPGADLLAVRRDDGAEVLIPFVRSIVPTVDVAAGRLYVDPPDGLLEL